MFCYFSKMPPNTNLSELKFVSANKQFAYIYYMMLSY